MVLGFRGYCSSLSLGANGTQSTAWSSDTHMAPLLHRDDTQEAPRW